MHTPFKVAVEDNIPINILAFSSDVKILSAYCDDNRCLLLMYI